MPKAEKSEAVVHHAKALSPEGIAKLGNDAAETHASFNWLPDSAKKVFGDDVCGTLLQLLTVCYLEMQESDRKQLALGCLELTDRAKAEAIDRHWSLVQHSCNVATVVSVISGEMGCNPQFRLVAHVGSFLHDIGKIDYAEFRDNRTFSVAERYQKSREHSELGYNFFCTVRASLSFPPLNLEHWRSLNFILENLSLFPRYHHFITEVGDAPEPRNKMPGIVNAIAMNSLADIFVSLREIRYRPDAPPECANKIYGYTHAKAVKILGDFRNHFCKVVERTFFDEMLRIVECRFRKGANAFFDSNLLQQKDLTLENR